MCEKRGWAVRGGWGVVIEAVTHASDTDAHHFTHPPSSPPPAPPSLPPPSPTPQFLLPPATIVAVAIAHAASALTLVATLAVATTHTHTHTHTRTHTHTHTYTPAPPTPLSIQTPPTPLFHSWALSPKLWWVEWGALRAFRTNPQSHAPSLSGSKCF